MNALGGDTVIAELFGKISSSGSNLTDRLEDNLTGDVFGVLRYLPFHIGMAQILRAARIKGLSESVERSTLSFWGDRIRFWPYHEEGELDACLELDDAVVGIEVKYLSGLSSDDEVENSTDSSDENPYEESRNQLARESRIIKEWAGPERKAHLIFIAGDSACAAVCGDVQARNIIADGVSLGYVSWQEVLLLLSDLTASDPFQRLMLDDLIRLLRRKGFERFRSFELGTQERISPEDYFLFNYNSTGFQFALPHIVNGGDYFEYR